VARVILADDHPLFIEALTEAVEGAGIQVVGTANRGDDLIELTRTTEADAVLLDLSMPGRDGFECLEVLRKERPNLALIVISASDDEADIRRALDLGAVCFVGKATDPRDLAGAIHVLLLDSVHLPAYPANGAVPDRGSDGETAATAATARLTPRELEILRLAAGGKANAQIAAELWVTEQTVKFHLSNTYRKIGVSNRTGASRWAETQGLL
jgi:DNA-binding NarL/FixJ family response regulator